MSTSRHPVALRLERLGRTDATLLALVMWLPLIDGVFAALILAGGLNDPLGVLQVGLLIFGGSATVAVILADMDGTPREQAATVLLVGLPLILVAGIQAAFAPTIESVLDLVIFERFAALVIAAIAAKTASATVGDYLPGAGVIIALGLLASVDPAGAVLAVSVDPALVARGAAAATIGVAFALSLALAGPYIRPSIDLDRFRFGSALALALLPLSLLGMPFGNAPLVVLVIAALFAFDPGEEWTPLRIVRRVSAGRLPDGGREQPILGGVGWHLADNEERSIPADGGSKPIDEGNETTDGGDGVEEDTDDEDAEEPCRDEPVTSSTSREPWQ